MAADERDVHEATGVIVLAQEDRFRLQTKDGRSLLLTLGKRARASIEDLETWAGSGQEVLARYYGEPDQGAVAADVVPS